MVVDDESGYPYIVFKKEPFRSFALIKRRDIGSFYLKEYNLVSSFYHFFNKNILTDNALNLENIYWFLLLRKYLKEDKEENKNEFYKYIKKCEMMFLENGREVIGFKFSHNSQQQYPDIWSTYFALANLKLLGLLEEYLASDGVNQIKRKIKRFLLSQKNGNSFLHCKNQGCVIDEKTSRVRTFYYVLEIFSLLGIDIRVSSAQYRKFIGERKRDPTIVFKLICLKYFDLDHEVSDKEIQYLNQFERENGGYAFKKEMGRIDTTFWISYILDIYSRTLDYNPVGIYSFVNMNINEIAKDKTNWNLSNLKDLSKLIILLSIIWKKFIEEIERVLFRELEKEKYIDLNQITAIFGLSHGIEEVIAYINKYYNFNLKIINNQIEFKHYFRNLSKGKKVVAEEVYEQLSKKSVISLKEVHKKYKKKHSGEALKLRDDIIPLVQEMMKKNFFKGKIVKKKVFKLDFFIEKQIVSDTELDLNLLIDEKEKLKDYKNTMYNMIQKLKNVASTTREEIESYLLINEINIAKERIKFLLHKTLLEADFLNENIEQSFNEKLYYIDLQQALAPEIRSWTKQYLILKNRLKDLDVNFKVKIEEKEKSRQFNKILDELEVKILDIEVSINRKFDSFTKFFRNNLESDYSDEKLNLIMEQFDGIIQSITNYDRTIYKISQKITVKEEKLIKKHQKVINSWISIKENLDSVFEFYLNGFKFFRSNTVVIDHFNERTKKDISIIRDNAQEKVDQNRFDEAFDLIKKESDLLLNEKTKEIKILKENVKKEIKSKRKLYLLYKYLQEQLEELDENLIELVAEQVQSLKNKVTESMHQAKIRDFDDYVFANILDIKTNLRNHKKKLEQISDLSTLKIQEVIKGFDNIRNHFNKINNTYSKKLRECRDSIEDFDEKSKVTIIQWDKFNEYINNEVESSKDEYINNIINKKIEILTQEKKSNNIKIADLKKELNLKCNIIMDRIKGMIDISKLDGELYEKEKCLLVFTDHYYKNKELKSYIDNVILKSYKESVGQILALYDSTIKNKTLRVNILEIQNRIADLKGIEKIISEQFDTKADELKIDRNRKEFVKTKKALNSFLEENVETLKSMKTNLILFSETQNFIVGKYNDLKIDSNNLENLIIKKIEKNEPYEEVIVNFSESSEKLQNAIDQTQSDVEDYLKQKINTNNDTKKFDSELREIYVNIKNEFLLISEETHNRLDERINYLKNETLSGKFTKRMNKIKIHLSQLLGTIQRKIEDRLDAKDYKTALTILRDQTIKVDIEIKDSEKEITNIVKDYNKISRAFKTRNKYSIEEYKQFLKKFRFLFREKLKSLEQLILTTYIKNTIKGVSNEYVTVGWLNKKLGLKKSKIEDYLLELTGSGELPGKFELTLSSGTYYENEKKIQDIEIDDLEVVFPFIKRLKLFASRYGAIISLVAAIFSIASSVYVFSGGHPATILIPLISVPLIFAYVIYKRKKEEKIEI